MNKVGTSLITTRRVIFVPNTEIKDELARTSINITCYDRNGELVKRVTSSDEGNVEDPENEGASGNENQNENQNQGGGNGGSQSGNGSVTPTDPNLGGNTGDNTGGGNDNPPAGDEGDEG